MRKKGERGKKEGKDQGSGVNSGGIYGQWRLLSVLFPDLS